MNASERDWETSLPESFITFTSVYTALIVCIGLCGNCFCLAAAICYRELRRESMRFHVLALALSDLTFILTLSLLLLHHVHFRYPSVPGLCELSLYLWYLSCFLSGWFILVMSAERCLAVYKPFLTPRLRRLSPKLLLAVTIIGLCFNLWVPCVTTSRNIVRFDNETQLDEDFWTCDVREDALQVYEVFSQVDTILSFTVPLFAVFIFNAAILARLFSKGARRSAFPRPSTSCDSHTREEGLLLTAPASSQRGATTRADGDPPLLSQPPKKQAKLRLSCPGEKQQRTVRKMRTLSSSPSMITTGQSGRQTRRRKLSLQRRVLTENRKATMVLVSVSLTYLVLNLPSYAVRVYRDLLLSAEDFANPSRALQYTEQICRLLFYSQFAVNFFLYSLHWILGKSGLKATAKQTRKRLRGTPIVLNASEITWSTRGLPPPVL